ncbi:hypothetical protein M011DRAFT_57167 [Sporormia fimetaria CBS 119925]|uniref:Uncharacterized protein n=1 Tax=Sporormia fimetaria CBS 119925 TaxID=1340428 RepID=A0A6A6V9R9_9PLEO|nr:hypothetical protein M011DRAFT_57167 [Sporormia fimetaria CBS 119925]
MSRGRSDGLSEAGSRIIAPSTTDWMHHHDRTLACETRIGLQGRCMRRAFPINPRRISFHRHPQPSPFFPVPAKRSILSNPVLACLHIAVIQSASADTLNSDQISSPELPVFGISILQRYNIRCLFFSLTSFGCDEMGNWVPTSSSAWGRKWERCWMLMSFDCDLLMSFARLTTKRLD